ncbi:MAG: PAS domain-containing protein [Planctomycetes bacterium]|jgi:PAS domain S-box-containing protein|nr:PAS domain-containing protein [Planctomycetota bacterium]
MPHRAHAILNSIPAAILRYDRDGRIRYANETAARRLRRPVAELEGKTLVEIAPPSEVRDLHVRQVERVFDTAEPVEYESLALHSEEEATWVQIHLAPEFDTDGRVESVLSVGTDLTRWKEGEEQLRLSEERLRLATEVAGVGIWEWNVLTGQIRWNAQMFRLYGIDPTPGGLVTYETWSKAVLSEDLPSQEATLGDTVRQQGTSTRSFRIRVPCGEVRHIEAAEQARVNAAGLVAWVIGTNVDVTARKTSVEQLRRSERRFQAFFEHTPAVAWIKGPDGRYQFISRAMAEQFGGADRWLGRTDEEVLPAEVAAVVSAHDRAIRETSRPLQVEEEVPFPDGTVRPWQVVKFPIVHEDGSVSAGGIAFDLSERRRLEQEKRLSDKRLYESLKLESLGILAGGIAHDFNNLLTSILGFASLAQRELTAGRFDGAPEYLNQVETAAGRAADLCKQMLAYAGKGKFIVRPVSITSLVEEMAQLLQAAISKKAVLRFLLDRDRTTAECDATQIRQVVMNLITNASDAIGDKSGVITVSTGLIDADAKYLADIRAAELRPAQYVYIEVSDTGCGMEDSTKAKIFEPFFTTKFTGRGLGLAAVQGIVRGHQGAIKVYSAPGRGTTFKVLLPAVDVSTPDESVPKFAEVAGRQRVILVVDDEENVRVFTRKALEIAGFRVLTANDGKQAIKVYRQNAGDITVVVCDLTMPHLDGAATFRQLRRISPEVRVILSSGFAEEEATAGLGGMGLSGFLRKPYRAAELLRTVADVIDKMPG